MKTMKHTGKKALSVFLAVLMVMTAWVFVAPTEAEASGDKNATQLYSDNIAILNTLTKPAEATLPTKNATFHFAGTGDQSGHMTADNLAKSNANIVYTVDVTQSVGAGVQFSGVTNSDQGGQGVRVWFPETVLMVDGKATPRMPVILEVDSNGSEVRACSCAIVSGADGLSFSSRDGSTHWRGDSKDDACFYYLMWIGKQGFSLTSDGTTSSGTKYGVRGGDWRFFANHLVFNSTMDQYEWLRTIKPTWRFYSDKSSTSYWTGTTNKNIYVVNVKGYNDLINEIFSGLEEVKKTPQMYTTASVQAYVNAIKGVINANPANYNIGGAGGTGANNWNAAISNAKATYDSAVANAKKATYTLTFKDIDGNVEYTRTYDYGTTVNLAELAASVSNTLKQGNEQGHQTYTWGNLSTSHVVTDDVTISESPKAIDAHTYGDYTQGATEHSRTCSVCGYVQTQAHIKGTGYVTKAETCTEDGVMTYDCLTCGKKAIATSVINNITGHDFNEIVIKEDGENGSHWRKCSRCDAYGWSGVENNCENHKWDKNADNKVDPSDAIETKASTCKEAGYEKYTCKVCNATWTKTLPLADHKITATAKKDVTNQCGGDGNEAFWTCSVCKRVWKDANLTDELTDTTDADGDSIPDALETKGPDHEFTGAYVNVTNGANGTHYRQCARFTQCGKYGLMVDGVAVEGATEAHKFTSKTEASTCTKAGKTTYTCSGCKHTYTETLELAAHTMTTIAAVAATCTTGGNNKYYKCTACSQYFKDENGTTKTTVEAEKIAELKHTFIAGNDIADPTKDRLETAATCLAPAVYVTTCDRCSVESPDSRYSHGNPIAHVYNGTKKSNGDGTHSYACTNDCNCGTYGVGSTKDATENCVYSNYSKIDATKHKLSCACGDYKEEGHSYGSWIADTTGVGTGKGTMTRNCPLCGQTETTECSYTEIDRVNATCDDPGSVTYKCTDKDCGHTYTETLPALGHEWVENNETYLKSAATCEANAVYYKYCTKCQKSSQTYTGETWTKKNSKLTHDWYEWVQSVDENGVAIHTRTCKHASSASCTEKGTCSGGTANCVDKKVCTVCKTAYGEVDSTNHKTVETKAKVPATCQTEGKEAYRYCEACKTALEKIVKIEKLDHKYGDWSKIAGEDKHTRSCTTCKIEDGTIATETEDCTGGTAYCNKLARCKDCKEEYGELDLANHSTESNHLVGEKDATCQAPGYTGDFYYDCCDTLKEKGTETAQLAHTYDIEVEGSRIPATCIAKGEVTYKCSTCDEGVAAAATNKVELPIDAKNHASKETTTIDYKAATCKDDGYTGDKYYTCCYDETKTAEENKKALAERGSVIKADGNSHTDLKAFDAVLATCQSAGNKAYSYCSTCNTYLINGEKVTQDQTREDKIPHKFTTYETNHNGTHTATCDTCDPAVATPVTDTKKCSGGTAYCTDLAECSVCKGTYGKVDATNHKSLINVAKLDSTCQKEGYEAYQYCEACNKNITEMKIISKKAHKFGEWTPVDGKDEHTRSCTTCVDTDELDIATETEACKGGTATCKNKAKCSVCDQEYGAINPNNHISDEIVTEARVEATCQQDGWTGREYYKCCYVAGADNTAALKNPGTTLPKVAHKYVEVKGTRVPATCLTKGSVTYKCSTCDEKVAPVATKKEELKIDKNNHASEEILTFNAAEATCSTDGYSGDKYHACCYESNKTTSLIQKGYKIPATGDHKLINPVPEYLVEYTKTDGVITGYTKKADTLSYEEKIAFRDEDDNKWYHVQICEDCGKIVKGACFTYEHTSTCTTTDSCEICGGLCSLVNPKNHAGKLILIPAVPATGSTPGTIAHYKCECGKLFFDEARQNQVEDLKDLEIEVTIEHEINEEIPAIPNGDGTHSYTCGHCGEPIVEDCSGGTATCQSKAECSICGQQYGEIDAKNHITDEVVIVGKKDATCSDSGYTGDAYYKCCYVEGADNNSKALKAEGKVIPNDPSLHVMKLRDNLDGTHTEYCEGCGTYELAPVAHIWVAGNVPETASCTEGYDLGYTCICGATKTEHVDAKGHDYAETVKENPADCTTEGEKIITKTCKVCGATETVTETIAALGHDKRTIKGVPATCSTNGSTDYIYCNRCDTVLQDTTVIPATGCEDKNNDGFCDSCGDYLRINEDGTNCNCICHKKNVFMKLLYKFLNFFWKLFKIEKTCGCGAVQHW